MPGKIHYSSEDMQNDLHEIIRQMTQSGFVPDIIFGIARGGLIPATMLSHYFNVPLVCLNISLRDDKVDRGHDSMDTLRTEYQTGRNILLVDDICDSGATLRKIIDNISFDPPVNPDMDHVRTAVLWSNISQDEFEAEYVGREISRIEDDRWIIFPYEEWWRV